MAIIVQIMGHSGSGKSTSMKNIVGVPGWGLIKARNKPLPFRGSEKIPTVHTNNYSDISKFLVNSKAKSIVIDDSNYLITDEFIRNAHVTGFQKFTDMCVNYVNLVNLAAGLPDYKIIYFFGHTDKDAEGFEKFKTIGKMMDEKVCLQGLYTVVIKCVVKDGEHFFSTHNSGMDTVKTPIGMFDSDLIPNDLKLVDDTIREYYGINIESEDKK